VGSHKDILIGKAKAALSSKPNKEVIHCFSSAGRCSPISRKAGLHHACWLSGKINFISPNIPLSSFFPLVLLLRMMSYGIKYPLVDPNLVG